MCILPASLAVPQLSGSSATHPPLQEWLCCCMPVGCMLLQALPVTSTAGSQLTIVWCRAHLLFVCFLPWFVVPQRMRFLYTWVAAVNHCVCLVSNSEPLESFPTNLLHCCYQICPYSFFVEVVAPWVGNHNFRVVEHGGGTLYTPTQRSVHIPLL